MWSRLAEWFEMRAASFVSEALPLERPLADSGEVWSNIARKHGLAESDIGRLASPWHTDADLGRPIEVVTEHEQKQETRLSGLRSN
jgi:hypothetical protein